MFNHLILPTMATALIVLSVLLATAFAAVPQNGRSTVKLERIYGGSDAPDGEYPFQVLLRTGDLTYCGGSIISNEWILTAASCVFMFRNITVQVGSNQQSTGGTTYKVLEAIYHEKFIDDPYVKADVGLLRVEPMTFTNKVQPIALDVKEIGANETCIISGWGKLDGQHDDTSENLQHFQAKTVSIKSCQEKYGERKINGDEELCTLAEGRQGACEGDRGGPVVRKVNGKYEQLGIVSWGYLCAVYWPDVHIRVSAYSRWIRINCNNCA